MKTTLGNQPVARIEFPINVTIDNLQNKDVYNLFLNLNNQIIADYKVFIIINGWLYKY